ncbi:MAG: tRNA uridine(34) 5-carboxymethylaminomethyl modification radical SAM/GNAT enzyme Elp3 [Candidatus Diapherotrites archaeon]|nr:tRNA uridine(34) 5-carboxymethylaminomethyl modification radical SAM/GNAT enzyme Elp3 [Candidatus Diapherotrites archaeon]
MSIESFVLELNDLIDSGKIKSFKELNLKKMILCRKHSVKKIPTNPDLLSLTKNPSEKAKQFLSIKSTRSISGVQIIAVMVKPHKCPGQCIYCSTGIGVNTPKSYTGKEPAAMRGLMFKFNAFKQARNRIEQLDAIGHKAEKIELIVMGGTLASMPYSYQKNFVKRCLDAVTEKKNNSFKEAKLSAEKSLRRIIGITFETRPDYCGKKEINRFLELGGTRVELGVQNPDDEIYSLNKRNHSVLDVINSTQLLKDSAFKIVYHLMPGMYGSNEKKDLLMFRKVFSNPEFKPDMLKIYPCLVIKGTKLYELYKKNEFTPLSNERAAKLIAKLKEEIPPWVRIMRIQRDIPAGLIDAGVTKSNLRELVETELKKNKTECKCIRCREAGINARKGTEFDLNEFKLFTEKYDASKGKELFISFEDKKRKILAGFTRLRIPSTSFRKEIDSETALIRELHVYGEALAVGKHKETAVQHKGIGQLLINKAEELALNEFDKKKMIIISGLGVKNYYKEKFNYSKKGVYMFKNLKKR